MASAPATDDEVELPPIDADDDEPSPAADEDDEIDERPGDGNPFDDGVAEDLDPGVDVDDLEVSLGDDVGEPIDVGSLDEGIDFGDERGDDSDGLLEESDDALDVDDGGDDGGAEGTDDAPEDEVNADALPALDADEEGADDKELAEALFAEATESSGFSGAARWELLAGAGADVPCEAVATAGGRVAAGGDALLLGEGLGPARAIAVAGSVAAVALADGLLAIATRRGQVLWGDGASSPTTPLGGWRPAIGPRQAPGFGATRGPILIGNVALAATPGRLFLLSDGALWSFTPTGERLTSLRSSGVRAIAASASTVALLARDGEGSLFLELFRGDDERLPTVGLTGEARRVAGGSEPYLAVTAGGRVVALGDGATLLVSRDGGASFRAVAVASALAATFVGDRDDAALVTALLPDAGGVSALLHVDESGESTPIGHVGGASLDDLDGEETASRPPEDDLARPSLAWDPTSDVLWVASRAGLQAFRRQEKH